MLSLHAADDDVSTRFAVTLATRAQVLATQGLTSLADLMTLGEYLDCVDAGLIRPSEKLVSLVKDRLELDLPSMLMESTGPEYRKLLAVIQSSGALQDAIAQYADKTENYDVIEQPRRTTISAPRAVASA